METKICTKCHTEKPISEFGKDCQKKDGLRSDCKECVRQRCKKSYQSNKEVYLERNKKYHQAHSQEIIEYKKEYYTENKEAIKEKYQKHYQDNKEHIKAKVKKYRKQHKIQRNKRERKRLNSEPLYKLTINIRKLISKSIRSRGYSKHSKTSTILGCSFEELMSFLFGNATVKYSNFVVEDFLKKYSYEVHHKVPLHTATTEQELIELNHYTNLELLTVEDHRKIHSGGLL